MALSFHEKWAPALERLPSGLCNCSLPNWSDFDVHFRCNVVKECVGGEDEIDCPYTGHCGLDRLTIDGQCYEYNESTDKMSWFEAQTECVRRGGYLASLTTAREWARVHRVMGMRSRYRDWYSGLRHSPSSLPAYYAETFIWADNTIALYAITYMNIQIENPECGAHVFYKHRDSVFVDNRCYSKQERAYLCEIGSSKGYQYRPTPKRAAPSRNLPLPKNQTLPFPVVRCPSGHLTHLFLACDPLSACWANDGHVQLDDTERVSDKPSASSCAANIRPLPPVFRCKTDMKSVVYSLVCDGKSDCTDRSDELFCHFPPCPPHLPFPCSSSAKCVSEESVCNRVRDCYEGSDEAACVRMYGLSPLASMDRFKPTEVPTVVEYDTKQYLMGFSTKPWDTRLPCPDTHFPCSDDHYCLPLYVLCNAVYDCPGHEDEEGCATYTCPGFYRCQGSAVCLHATHLCDGMYHCPQQDDEEWCHEHCPQNCTCQGRAYVCGKAFPAGQHHQLRYLDASHSGMTQYQLLNNTLLIFLRLAYCQLAHLNGFKFLNLHVLDVSNNFVHEISAQQLRMMINLKRLILAGNPLTSPGLFPGDISTFKIQSLEHLDLGKTNLDDINLGLFSFLSNLQYLNFSHSKATKVSRSGMKISNNLRTLDLRGCPVTEFPKTVFRGLEKLEQVFTDNYRLCCSQLLPDGFNPNNCHSPFDEVSSCDDLLRSSVYRVALAVYSASSIIGNVASFFTRVFYLKNSGKSGFSIFVTHLCLSDFLMGVYLAIVGVADRLYMGDYVWMDVSWRHSSYCKLAGFLSLLSNEMSAFVICIITLDRFLALRFPFSKLKFRPKSAWIASVLMWSVCVVLAAIPLSKTTQFWQFYSQTSICIPLPITNTKFAGHSYAFGLIIVMNFILFLFIALGQLFIYFSIRANAMAVTNTTRKSQDLKIARHLITIALSNFLCWFPVGLLGVMAANDVTVSSEVNVAMAVFVLPVNAALNPFLYNLSMVMDRRRRWKKEHLLKLMNDEAVKNEDLVVT